jgi:hypothetical protein
MHPYRTWSLSTIGSPGPYRTPFRPTDVPSVALGLLQDVKMRETMEQRGLQYMVDEHTAASVSSGETSALANLVEALTELSKSYLHTQC